MGAAETGLVVNPFPVKNGDVKPGKRDMAMRTQKEAVFGIDTQMAISPGQLLDLTVGHAVHMKRLLLQIPLQRVFMNNHALAFHEVFFIATMQTMHVETGAHTQCFGRW